MAEHGTPERGANEGVKGEAELPRVLGLGDVIGIVIGSVIGSGIFIVPATIAASVHSPLLILAVWLVGGVLALAGAVCFAELGGLFPHAGGMYVYLREAYGPLVAFLFGWTVFLVIDAGACATLSSAFATKYLPHFVTLTPAGQRLVMVAFVAFLTLVNVVGVRHGANLQNALTVVKIVAIVAVCALVFAFGRGDPANFVTPALPPLSSGLGAGFGVALVACLWAYKGWEAATFSAGELRRPQRDLFLGLLVGNGLVFAAYLATNLAYLWVVPAAEMARSDRIAADALARSVGPAAASAVSLLILLSILGSANTNLLTTPRVTWAMAADGVFFRALGRVHPRFRTPHVAILALGAWAALLATSGTFEQLLTYVIFGQWIFFGLTGAAVLVLRRTRRDLPRPVRAWGYPLTPLLFVASAVAIAASALASQPGKTLAGLAIVLLGVPACAFWRRRSGRATPPPRSEARRPDLTERP